VPPAANAESRAAWSIVHGASTRPMWERPCGELGELLEVVRGCEGETSIQLKWLRTRMKAAASQALVVA